MLTHRNLRFLWLLLLLHASESTVKFKLFNTDGNPEPQEGDLRLSGSQSFSEGRVEIYHGGQWGTVCDDGWDLAEAQVVCRQLRFPGAKSVAVGKDYGQAPGPIWLDDIECKGTESHLSSCDFQNWGVTDCSHKEDVGVVCETAGTNATSDDSTHSLDHSISLSDDLGKIFDSGNDCDFLISVQSPTGNKQEDGTPETVGTTICAHKIILSQFPLFGASGENTSITVEVSQTCQPHVTSFIRYIYTRKMDVTFSSVQCLHWMASRFGVKQLMEDIGRLFSKILPDDTLFYTPVSIYDYAESSGDFVLQENSVQYLAWNFENLTRSPAWTGVSVKLLGCLLARSDLVVSDEYFLLQTVESWITGKGKSISLETQVDLLNRIRFPMIPAEKLYDLESNSSLYSTHKDLYRENMLTALQFNVLLFSNLPSNPKFSSEDDDYQPRIYTASPWSVGVSNEPPRETVSIPSRNQYRYQYNRGRYNVYPTVRSYGYSGSKSFSTPIHNSLIFKGNQISWEANIFRTQYECSNRGVRCESLPMARLTLNQYIQNKNIAFHNRFVVICQDKYVCQVQDFKDYRSYVPMNGTQAYPCPDEQYTYRFVVRPQYI